MSDPGGKLAELGRKFAARAREERAALAQAMADDDRTALRDRAHKLAGIAPMVGFPRVGEAALALELAAEDGAAITAPAQALDQTLAAIEV